MFTTYFKKFIYMNIFKIKINENNELFSKQRAAMYTNNLNVHFDLLGMFLDMFPLPLKENF